MGVEWWSCGCFVFVGEPVGVETVQLIRLAALVGACDEKCDPCGLASGRRAAGQGLFYPTFIGAKSYFIVVAAR